MWHSHAQEALNWMVYIEGTEIQDHIKLLQIQKVMVDNLSTSIMDDKSWRGIIIQSILPMSKWLPVILSLYTMSSSADIISTLFTHRMIIGRDTKLNGTNLSNTVLAAQMNDGCTNPNCKAKKQSTHTTANCYWPGGGKEGQFPPNFGQRNWANAGTSTPTQNPFKAEHFVLSAWIPDNHYHSGILIDELVDHSPMALISRGF